MISDEILFLDREFRDRERGTPSILLISPEDYASLREELRIDEYEDFVLYHGMEIVVSEDQELQVTTPYLLNVEDYIDEDFE